MSGSSCRGGVDSCVIARRILPPRGRLRREGSITERTHRALAPPPLPGGRPPVLPCLGMPADHADDRARRHRRRNVQPGFERGPSVRERGAGTPTATSDELIGDALAAGTITYEESLVDRALALFGSQGLPEKFRSPQPNLDDGTALFAEIEANQST